MLSFLLVVLVPAVGGPSKLRFEVERAFKLASIQLASSQLKMASDLLAHACNLDPYVSALLSALAPYAQRVRCPQSGSHRPHNTHYVN